MPTRGASAELELHGSLELASKNSSSIEYLTDHLQVWSVVQERANVHCSSSVSPPTSPFSDTTIRIHKHGLCRIYLTVFCRDTADGEPQPPCLRCRKENKQCVIGSSNRGGRRVRRSTIASQQLQGQTQGPAQASTQSQSQSGLQAQKTPNNDETTQEISWFVP